MMNQTTDHTLTRRRFLERAGGSVALTAMARWGNGAETTTAAAQPFLHECGFWEYIVPYTGGFESYDLDDYRLALDDMAGAGMNSLMLMVKWFTTGYRSKLPYLDQSPDNKNIASGNELLRKVMAEAKARRIKVWLGVVTSHYDADKCDLTPRVVTPGFLGCPFKVGFYDPDVPGMIDHGARIFEELLDEFPQPDGFMLEMEDVDARKPYRVAPYNAWAAANNRPPYGDPAMVSGLHWFDYQTAAIIRATKAVETTVRGKGFHGDLATINKLGETRDKSRVNKTGNQLVNIEMMRRDCPAWATINYNYDKGRREGDRDWCMVPAVTYPKGLGMNVYYLPRGVMTYQWREPPWERQELERSWAEDVADVLKYQPQNLWWFGAGGKSDGIDTSIKHLKRMGYADDVAARRALLKIAAPLQPAMTHG